MTKWPADKVERRALEVLIPDARNARKHSPAQIAQIAGSMKEWGWTNPVLVDEGDRIIAGHGRVLAAGRLGFTEVPVMVAEGWTEAQKRAYIIADNQLALAAEWDMDLLASEVQGLAEWNFDLSLLGSSDLDELLAGDGKGGLTEPDDVPPAPSEPICRQGDIWLLGRHRLGCGDCRDPKFVAELIDGREINLGFTSPPYAQQRDYDASSGFTPIKPADYVEWFSPVAANVAANLADDGSWFVNIKPAAGGLDTELYVFDLVLAHARQWGWHFATEFCWERPGVPKGVTQRFKNEFEPIYQFVRNRWKMRPNAVRHKSDSVPVAGGPGSGNTSCVSAQGQPGSVATSFGAVKKRRNGTRSTMSNVQGQNVAPAEYIRPGLAYPGNRLPTFARSHQGTGHAAAFPVGLPQFFCLAYTDENDLVFDPFLGSGSTIMAAEIAGRVGAGIDLSPAYCDVSLKRWQNYTGQFATLEGDGRSFDAIATEREVKAA